jgi:hypothetical protein
MKGIIIEVYLPENGEFICTLPPEPCSDDDKIRELIDVLKGMPQDKARVWGTRLN